jgi:GNAT superfamily N-acetyltransferase
MEIYYRPVNLSDPEELNFIARMDSAIPAAFDSDVVVNADSINGRLHYYSKLVPEDTHFEAAVILENKTERVVGFHLVTKTRHTKELFAGAVNTLWVDPAFRNCGIATQLKNRGEAWARLEKLDHLHTMVSVKNDKMLALNEKLGFELVNYKLKKKL